ncbi:hypothetical protein [Aeoliella mucimassa]|uniref:Uncharacterized protein n=1 Tax=Aeoliella mucimassa TaxID=2527972 RepID=A0A518AIE6_9BACT|nr:hypothetical protein [Aeoliella mucimassa]QDU54434.1 hypothetical protein Pan181_06150 [Aeoliella mucimassa]
MNHDQCLKVMERIRVAGLYPSGYLLVSLALLVSLPFAYLLQPGWSIIAVLLFCLSQVVVVCQGAGIVVSCGWVRHLGKLRRYGLYLVAYGVGSLVGVFWLAALATFGGPPRDQVPLFLAKLWLVAVVCSIPPAVYLRRRGVVFRSQLKEWEQSTKETKVNSEDEGNRDRSSQ